MIGCEIFVEPDLYASFLIEADHLVVELERAHLVVALLEAPQALAQDVNGLREGQTLQVSEPMGDSLVDDLDVLLISAHGGLVRLQVLRTVNLNQCPILLLAIVVDLHLVLDGVERIGSNDLHLPLEILPSVPHDLLAVLYSEVLPVLVVYLQLLRDGLAARSAHLLLVLCSGR